MEDCGPVTISIALFKKNKEKKENSINYPSVEKKDYTELNINYLKEIVNQYKNIDIKDVSGQINLNDISGLIKLSSSTGNRNIKTIKGILEIDTLTGDVNINNFKIEGDSKIENISGDITVSISKDSICKIDATNENGKLKINKEKCNDKKNIFEIKNITGNINIK